MDNNQVKVSVYDSGDRLLYESTLFGMLAEFGEFGNETAIERAAYIRVFGLSGSICFDVEAPRRE